MTAADRGEEIRCRFSRLKAGADIHLRLLYAMGFDLASVHAASPRSAGAIAGDLDNRPRRWLNDAATTAAAEVRRDFREWKKYMKRRW
jgi:hypothetical protein